MGGMLYEAKIPSGRLKVQIALQKHLRLQRSLPPINLGGKAMVMFQERKIE